MHRIVVPIVLLGAMAAGALDAQPWPLVRLRQAGGLNPEILQNPAGSPGLGVQIIGFSSLTGKPESWQLETHASFEAVQQFDEGRDPRAMVNTAQTVVLAHRPVWSHRAEEAVEGLRRARYLQVSIFQVGIGSEGDFSNLLAARRSRLDVVNLNRPELAYQAIFGGTTGMIVVITPLASLKQLDEGVNRSGSGYLRTSGVPVARNGAATAPAQLDLLQENILFQVRPGLSSVSNEFSEADPAFWRK